MDPGQKLSDLPVTKVAKKKTAQKTIVMAASLIGPSEHCMGKNLHAFTFFLQAVYYRPAIRSYVWLHKTKAAFCETFEKTFRVSPPSHG
jgi:hypothetical protein